MWIVNVKDIQVSSPLTKHSHSFPCSYVTLKWRSQIYILSFDLSPSLDICVSKNLLNKSIWNLHLSHRLNSCKLNSSPSACSLHSNLFLFLLHLMNWWHYHPPSQQSQNLASYLLLFSPMMSNPSINIVDFSYHVNWSWIIPMNHSYVPIWLCHLILGLLSS